MKSADSPPDTSEKLAPRRSADTKLAFVKLEPEKSTSLQRELSKVVSLRLVFTNRALRSVVLINEVLFRFEFLKLAKEKSLDENRDFLMREFLKAAL